MVKLTKRKGFNFFRSYYDVYNELENNDDKVAFINALFDRQFLGVKPTELTGMAKFAYISQTNSIDSQVKGYNDKAQALGNPPLGGAVGVKETKLTPSLQVQEEVQEKEEVKQQQQIEKPNINNSDFSDNCLSDPQWTETVLRKNNVKIDVIKLYIDIFVDHLITMEEQKENIKEFKSHFNNWLGKQDLSKHRTKRMGKTNQI